MFSTAEKTSKPAALVNRKAVNAPFIGPKLFTTQRSAENAQPSTTHVQLSASHNFQHGSNLRPHTSKPAPFFQTKLSVSSPGDAHEREADATADAVMRMSDVSVTASGREEEKLHRSSDEKHIENKALPATNVQRNALPDEEQVQAKEDERKEHETMEPIAAMLQREAANEEEKVQASEFSNDGSAALQRTYSHDILHRNQSENHSIQTTGQGRLIALQGSSRGPPTITPRFEQTLQQSTASGNALPQQTQNFMESRFGADFSGVRIHTDGAAQELSSSIRAHAFAYNNHIFFNSGKFDTDSSAGKTVLAHELTHTIQQGASPVASNVARKHQFTAVQSKAIQMSSTPQLDTAVTLARGEQGKVIANKAQPNGERVGADQLVDYFKTTFGEDKIVKTYTGAPNTVVESIIRKKSKTMGQVPNQPDPNVQKERDAMPSWCGIFVFWALNKAGIPMPKWKLGMPMMKPEAAYPAGYSPKAGDIAYRAKNSHYGLVTGVEAGKIKSVNGNTAGADNLGGEVQEQMHEPSQWQGFFNPLALATGPLSSSSATEQAQQSGTEPARSLHELRKAKFKTQRKETGNDEEKQLLPEEEKVHAKMQLSSWSVGADGSLQRVESELKEEEVEEHEVVQRSASQIPVENEERESGKVQTKTEASSTQHLQLTRAEAMARMHCSNIACKGMVQASWLGDAWDAVTNVVSEAAAWVEKGLDAAKDWILGKIRDFVMEIPGYRLLRYILGYDPITGENVVKSPETLLDGVIGLIPLYGHLIRPVLDYFHATTPVANWLFTAVNRFIGLIESIGTRFEFFFNSLSLTDIGDPGGVLQRVSDLLSGVVHDILNFVTEAASTFLQMVKDIALTNIGQFVQNHFPNAFDLLCVVLGQNPITHEDVPRNGHTIMDAGLKVLGERGAQIKQQITQNGIYAKAVAWIDRAIEVVTATVADITHLFSTVWGEITFESLFTPLETFARISEHFTRPIRRVTSFIAEAVVAILRILKDALLQWLSRTARGTRGYYLITVILGRDPFTSNEVERNTENLIHGFLSLMEGGEEQFQQMKESGAIERTTQRINAAVRTLNFTWPYIVGLFTNLWNSFDWTDLLHPLAAFGRIISTFANPVRRLVAFVVEIIKIVIEILLQVMNFPIDVVSNIIRRIMQVFHLVRRDPIGFLKNLLRAIKQGFVQFFNNIFTHLMRGLADWLFGQLGAIGIQMPPDLSFRSILNLVLQILGVSLQQIMDRVWRKLAERIGQEKVDKIRRMIDRLEGIWRFVRDVMERGPIAIWEYIQEQLSNLWDTVIDSIKNWIMEKVINAVISKLLSMLDPTGIMAVINSVIAIYRAVQSFIEYIRQLLEIVNSFVNGIAEIASGNIQVAADFLERTAARFIPIMIGFLANQVGLGRIAGKIVEMIERIRAMVNRAIDWLIEKALTIGMPVINGIINLIEGGERLVERGRQTVRNAAEAVLGWLGLRKTFRLANGEQHEIYFYNTGNASSPVMVASKDPATLEHILATRKWQGQNIPQPSYGIIQTKAGEIDALRPNQNVTTGEQIRLKFNDIAAELSKVGGQPIPATQVTPTGTMFSGTKQLGKTITANPLSLNAGSFAGSPPTVDSDMGNELKRRYPGYFVAGHLLNDNLHGPGNQRWNLVPLTQQGNSNMKTKIENPVKQKVLSEGAVVSYHVDVAYKSGGFNEADSVNDPEDHLPDAVTASIEELAFGNNAWAPVQPKPKWAKDASVTINNDTRNIANFGGAKALKINLNTSDARDLASLPAIGPARAAAIVKFRVDNPLTGNRVRWFTSVDQLAEKVSGIGAETVAAIKAFPNVKV